MPRGHTNGNGEHPAAGDLTEPAQAPLQSSVLTALPGGDGPHVRSQQFAKFQADAPACDNCGAITVRNGNCYLCHNCGNSMGCS
jgi:ribonucleoside-diphosphate reductase alpha chain